MNKNKKRKSIGVLFVLCFYSCIALFFIGAFSYLLRGWLLWDFDKPFPFGKDEIATVLKIGLLGIPTGFVFWFFNIR
ncbi:hypothetical protein EKL29_22695 [Pantoea sp. YU22]|uniref:hypothetical protein n=1 Tax=Pantoea TaxID=53335 RepID=UPI000F8923F1|nr:MULTISPECIES: hypothetical protein [Pantoea]RTY52562.1 hypothetical protein EKL29_22695 [Pantoea sp. YU22]